MDGVDAAEKAELVDECTVRGLRVDEIWQLRCPFESAECFGSRFLL